MTAHSSSEPIRVLVVDDDPIQRSLIQARLQRLRAITTDAADGVIAWSLMRRQTFDLAIIDLSMPNLDGIGLIQCMRGHPRTRHLPVIVVTSRSDSAAIEDSLRAGASSFLVKPVVWTTFEHHVGFLMELVRTSRDARRSSQRMSASSRAKDTIISTLFGDAANNARTILESLQSLERSVRHDPANEFHIKHFRNIEAESRAVMESARRALNTLQLLERQLIVDDKSVPLVELMETVVQTAQPEAEQRGVELVARLPNTPINVKCERSSVELALMCLLENAIECAPSGSRITVSTSIHGDGMVTMDVADQGPGISQDRLVRCLAPLLADEMAFQQSSPIGTGIMMAKAIIEAHDGKLEIRSQPGDGTTATLVLPADRTIITSQAA